MVQFYVYSTKCIVFPIASSPAAQKVIQADWRVSISTFSVSASSQESTFCRSRFSPLIGICLHILVHVLKQIHCRFELFFYFYELHLLLIRAGSLGKYRLSLCETSLTTKSWTRRPWRTFARTDWWSDLPGRSCSTWSSGCSPCLMAASMWTLHCVKVGSSAIANGFFKINIWTIRPRSLFRGHGKRWQLLDLIGISETFYSCLRASGPLVESTGEI